MRLPIPVLLLLGLLVGCQGEPGWSPPAQRWQDLTHRIETRPSPVAANGMNEFLVMADRPQKGFFNDLLVKVRTEGSEWRQAMPDGALAVFRRALPVGDPRRDRLHVLLIRNGERGELVFPLAPERESPAPGGGR
ncbi:MAG: hypothetical protein R8K47_00995 [Mariprofundaceae bacterium]